MSETVITAFISGFVTLIVCLINNKSQFDKLIAELDKHNAIQDERLVNLTKKVDLHNGVIERTYKLENATAVLDEKVKVANNRIADLERR